MVSHWTYRSTEVGEDLQQGDILATTAELREIFSDVHKHFLDPKYLAFMVLTQSCDLVRRKNGECKSPYITLACIRSLDDVLLGLLDQVCSSIGNGAYRKETKGNAKDLLRRVLNQNEQALGLFYLHTDADVGIASPSVVLLRVTISVRRQHYQTIVKARKGTLEVEFGSKLGWLVGNLYSRIGTPDWGDRPDGDKKAMQIIDGHLKANSSKGPVWLPSGAVDAALVAGVDLSSLARHDLVAKVEEHAPPPAKREVIVEILRVLEELLEESEDGSSLTAEALGKLSKRLDNGPIFGSLLKKAGKR